MKVNEIINFLNENGLSEVEELRKEKDLLLLNFYLDFDKDIIEAARAYADNESSNGTEEWMNEFYLPYLYDYANDEVLEIMEELIEEFEVEGEFMAFQNKEETSGYVQFMALFTNEENDATIEEIVKDYMQEKIKK